VEKCGLDMGKKWDIDIHIRLDKETVEEIDYLCNQYGLNRSQLIRLALKAFLRHQSQFLVYLGGLSLESKHK